MNGEKNQDSKIFMYSRYDGATVPQVQHYHNLFEIYFLEKGSCNYFIDNKSYEVKTGDVVLIPGGMIHKTAYSEKEYTRMLINCSGRFIPPTVAPVLPRMLPLYRNPAITDQIYRMFKNIEKEYTAPDSFSSDALVCCTHMLFFLLARNINECEQVNARNIHIDRIVRYIQENYSQPLKLSEIAKIFSLRPEHVSRTFKKETGFGFSEYINLTRMQQAEKLLLQKNNPTVSEVAFRCGFNDSNYFSLRFKELYGVPPKQYQKLKKI
ncbi:MAG: helix-turn-helix transcriptional regulator [Clostridia bacterium]|nr:helix-turn-helix transcriptional regulator [Clostridia bacterium]